MLVVYVVVFAFIGGILSLAGGVLLLASERIARALTRPLSAFAAGVLLSTAFLDVIPEAIARAGTAEVMRNTLIGFLASLLLETAIRRGHHERHHGGEPAAAIVIVGDTMHNFVDGVVIAGAFLAEVRLGIITALAVAAHEIPQEIGDFAVLLRCGFRRRSVLIVNLASSLATIAGALISLMIGEASAAALPAILGVSAGFFIYLSAADLVPEIQHGARETLLIDAALLLAGAAAVAAVTA